MALSGGNLTSGDVGGFDITTASIAPTSGDLVVVEFTAASNTSDWPLTAESVTQAGITFSRITPAAGLLWGSRRRKFIYAGISDGTSGAVTISVTTEFTIQEVLYTVDYFRGADGTTPYGTLYTATGAGVTSLSVTVSDTPDAGDFVYASISCEGASVTLTLNSELDTTLLNYEAGTQVRSHESAYDSSPDSTPAPGWTWTGANDAGITAMVINVASGGAATLTVADIAHSHSLDASGALFQNHFLSVAEVSHAHSLDAFALVQDQFLAVADIDHAHALDVAGVLIQAHLLNPADVDHAHALDVAGALFQDHFLVVADASHAHSLDALALFQDHTLNGVADISHAHALDSVVLVYVGEGTLTVQDILHGHALDAVTLSQVHNLIMADIGHAHALDALALTQVHNLAGVADIAHAHSMDAAGALVQAHNLILADIAHGHALDAVALSQVHNLIVADIAHAHGLDSVVITGNIIGLIALTLYARSFGLTLETRSSGLTVVTRSYGLTLEDR